MPDGADTVTADSGQRRATYQRARSHETKRALVAAAMALWRTNGYAQTTVADICRAAGVSRALFYFYFPAKEDVLFEVGLTSTRAAQKTVRGLLRNDYDVEVVIARALRSLERSMARNPRDLIVETILEGYRHEQGILADDETALGADMFGELFAAAQADGKIAAQVDVSHLSRLAQMHVSEGVRRWAIGGFGDRSFADVVTGDIAALITGFNVRSQDRR
ncbi:TetR/AcrR family transcriptional regulator [Mycolicibacterium litorale]|uniref:TetR family transcriptional regulator n=1 Tax=Mycolicibacterium litorale TaxID=758802 RepID=A0AAD1INK3_9MYCO|nr:TetR/AcrR family transcriptional regulator [Mycolicibacterium litorale]MCV7413981.1 TetR/AcrR family transcriptional regulator [Mycolicibacterium litorale]TDY03135.1 TetR family transcriptional regulator [Mycolicibacterium litorale]BBY14928.1 TetR family transcriptional regulator [Mycolicibacterium litorale]